MLPLSLKELIAALDTNNQFSLIRALALWQRPSDETIRALIRDDDAVVLINWIEEVDLTTYPPTVSPLPLNFVKTAKAFNRLQHGASHHLLHVYSAPDSPNDVTREARYFYRNRRHILFWCIIAPPGTEG